MKTENLMAQNYYDEAKNLESSGELEKAIYLYSEAIKEDYQFIDAYKARGKLLFQTEQYAQAIRDFEYLAVFDENENFAPKRAICYEKLENYTKCLQLYLEELLENVNIEAYKTIYNIVENHPEFGRYVNFSEINTTIQNFTNEERALKFRETASEENLDQRNDFLELSLMLLPEGSSFFYETFIEKADAEIFRYRLCYDSNFRAELKKQYELTEAELNKKYTYNAKRISELNLVYAIQKLNEATIYAQNLEDVNFLDEKVNEILKIAHNAE